MNIKRWIPILAWAVWLATPLGAQDAKPKYALHVGKIITSAGDPIDNGTILVSGGDIEAIGPRAEIAVPEGYRVLDYSTKFAHPGFIEAHNHVGGGSGDLNETVYPTNPELRVLDQVDPYNARLKKAIAGGVTTVLYIPGSGSNMGGFGAIFKTGPGTLDDVLVRFPGALKIAQAGNPERRGSGELGSGRQGMNWNIRETLLQGKRYNDAWLAYERGDSAEPPKVDLRLENLRKLFNKEIPVVVHTQIYQVVMMTVSMLHDELDLNVVIDHGTFDGYKLAPEMAKRGIPAMLGPRGIYYDREVGQIFGIPAMYYQGGVMAVGVNTDSPVIPQEDLVFQAAMAVHFGLPEDVALRGLTIEAAKALMIDDRVGSLEVGKDADIIIRNGPPIDIRSRVEQAFIDGRLIYDITRERQIY